MLRLLPNNITCQLVCMILVVASLNSHANHRACNISLNEVASKTILPSQFQFEDTCQAYTVYHKKQTCSNSTLTVGVLGFEEAYDFYLYDNSSLFDHGATAIDSDIANGINDNNGFFEAVPMGIYTVYAWSEAECLSKPLTVEAYDSLRVEILYDCDYACVKVQGSGGMTGFNQTYATANPTFEVGMLNYLYLLTDVNGNPVRHTNGDLVESIVMPKEEGVAQWCDLVCGEYVITLVDAVDKQGRPVQGGRESRCQISHNLSVVEPLSLQAFANACDQSINAMAAGGYTGSECAIIDNEGGHYWYELFDADGNLLDANHTGYFDKNDTDEEYILSVKELIPNGTDNDYCIESIALSFAPCCPTLCSEICTDLDINVPNLPTASCGGEGFFLDINVSGEGAYGADYNIVIQQDGMTIGEGVHFPGTPPYFSTLVFFENETCLPINSSISWMAICYGGTPNNPGTIPGDTIAIGTLADIAIYPNEYNFQISRSGGNCEEAPTIIPPICGDLSTQVTNADPPNCPVGEDGVINWQIDVGFDINEAPNCFQYIPLEGSFLIPACSNCDNSACGTMLNIPELPTSICNSYDLSHTLCIEVEGQDTAYDFIILGDQGGIGFAYSGPDGDNQFCMDLFFDMHSCEPHIEHFFLTGVCLADNSYIIHNGLPLIDYSLGSINIFPDPALFVPSFEFNACEADPIVYEPPCMGGEVFITDLVAPNNDCENASAGYMDWEFVVPYMPNTPACWENITGTVPIPPCLEGCNCDGIICGTVCTELEVTINNMPTEVCVDEEIVELEVIISGLGAWEADYDIVILQDDIFIGEAVHYPLEPLNMPAPVSFINDLCAVKESTLTWMAICFGGSVSEPGYEPGDTIATGTIGTINIFPKSTQFSPLIIPQEGCEQALQILPPPCGNLTVNPPLDAISSCGTEDVWVNWVVDLGFQTDCFENIAGTELVTMCDICICPTTASNEASIEYVCGDALPTIPENHTLGIDELDHAVVTWSPDINQLVASTCDLLRVTYQSIITCTEDTSIYIEGPTHTLVVYPDPTDYEVLTEDVACGEMPTIQNIGNCPFAIAEPLIEEGEAGCTILGELPMPGTYSWTVSYPFTNDSPCELTSSVITATVGACEDCPQCPTIVANEPTIEKICGSGTPNLPTIEALGLDFLETATVTWNPDPSEVITTACEVNTVSYIPTIGCIENSSVQLIGATHTLTVFPDPDHYQVSTRAFECGETPVLDFGTTECVPLILDGIDYPPQDGCTTQGNPPVPGSFSWVLAYPFQDAPCADILPTVVANVAGCEVCPECPSTISTIPTTIISCGNTTPDLPSLEALGGDNVENALLTWRPDPSEMIVSTCDVKEINYIPTITCSKDESVEVVGAIYTIKVYPDPNDFAVETEPANCGAIPSIIQTGKCDLLIDEPVIFSAQDGCTAQGEPPIEGHYTWEVDYPFEVDCISNIDLEPIVAAIAACEVCPQCPKVINGTATQELVVGDALPHLPPNEALGIDDLTNAIVEWTPDPSLLVNATCEPIEVIYTPTITCVEDSTLSLVGANHTLMIYPDFADFNFVLSDAMCNGTPMIRNTGACPLLFSEPLITPPIDGCTSNGENPINGTYTWEIAYPFPEAPNAPTYEPISAILKGCEICPDCPTSVTGSPSTEIRCGSGRPILPNISDLGIDDLSNAVLTWSPNPNELVLSTCEVLTVVYSSIIECSEDENTTIVGPTHTLFVYPDIDDYKYEVENKEICTGIPKITSIGNCPLTISEPIIVEAQAGCTRSGNPPIAGTYTWNLTRYPEETTCGEALEEVIAIIEGCENCIDCPSVLRLSRTVEHSCGNSQANLPENEDLQIDNIDNGLVTWEPDPNVIIESTCEVLEVVYQSTISCLDGTNSFLGPIHTLWVYPDTADYHIEVNAAACGGVPNITNVGTCEWEIGEPVIVPAQDGCLQEGNPPVSGNYTWNLTFPFEEAPCQPVNTTAQAMVKGCEVCPDNAPCNTPINYDTSCVDHVLETNENCCNNWGSDCEMFYWDCYQEDDSAGVIGFYIWIDWNENGIKDEGESGVEGVIVKLYDGEGNWVDTVVSDENGYFLFTQLPAGSYVLIFTLPDGYDFTMPNIGSDEATDSDVDPNNGNSAPIDLAEGDVHFTTGAGLLLTESDCSELMDMDVRKICENGVYNTYDLAISGSLGTAPFTISGDYKGSFEETYAITQISDDENFTIEITDDTGCSQTFSNDDFTPCIKLEVDLLSFDGEVITAGNHLSWITLSEEHNDYFSLYHATNGSDFKNIATIDGLDISHTTQAYTYLDKQASRGSNYYYLSQTDHSGKTTIISNTIHLWRGEQMHGETWMNVQTLPTQELWQVQYQLATPQPITLSIYNALGQLVFQQKEQELIDTHDILIPTTQLNTGMYLIVLNYANETMIQKVTK